MVYDCIIVGGGAAGMAAAITLGRQQKKVLLIEQCKELGQKLYATGNGRCNFTNSYYDEQVYRGEHPDFAQRVYHQFTYEDTILFMHSIGVLQQQKDGYFYPYTNQAKTVVHAMIRALPKDYVTLCLDRIVRRIDKGKIGFHVVTSYGEYDGKKVLLAMGGNASTAFKRELFNGYAIAHSLGHTVTLLGPALCPLYAETSSLKEWKGIRANACVALYQDCNCEKKISPAAVGEVQLTDYGISGVPVFQISRYASLALKKGEKVFAQLDFLPEYSENDLQNLCMRNKTLDDMTILSYLEGFVQEPLARMILRKCRLKDTLAFKEIKEEQWFLLVQNSKQYVIEITKTADFDRAQVTAGGVATDEVNPLTMESKKISGLYFAGELLDVDGTCGGYNIQFAFSSSQVAARAIGK